MKLLSTALSAATGPVLSRWVLPALLLFAVSSDLAAKDDFQMPQIFLHLSERDVQEAASKGFECSPAISIETSNGSRRGIAKFSKNGAAQEVEITELPDRPLSNISPGWVLLNPVLLTPTKIQIPTTQQAYVDGDKPMKLLVKAVTVKDKTGAELEVLSTMVPMLYDSPSLQKIKSITFKLTIGEPKPAAKEIIIRRISSDEQDAFWAKLNSDGGTQVNLKLGSHLWNFNRDRSWLEKADMVPLAIKKDGGQVRFSNFDAVISSFRSRGNSLVGSFGPKEDRSFSIGEKSAPAAYELHMACTNGTSSLPRDEMFSSNSLALQVPDADVPVIWLKAVRQKIEFPLVAKPLHWPLLVKAGDAGVALQSVDKRNFITAGDLKMLGKAGEIKLSADPIQVTATKALPQEATSDWINVSAGGEEPKSWTNIARSGKAPECIRFYVIPKPDEHGKVQLVPERVNVVDTKGIAGVELIKWAYASDDSKNKLEMNVERVNAESFVLLTDRPKIPDPDVGARWTHWVTFKYGTAIYETQWEVSNEDYQQCLNEGCIDLAILMRKARRKIQVPKFELEVSPWQMLQPQNPNGLVVTLQPQDGLLSLLQTTEMKLPQIQLEDKPAEAKPKRYIKPGVEKKKGVMILVDNYQPWGVGGNGAASIQGQIWDVIDATLAKFNPLPDAIVVGLVNQSYESFLGSMDERRRQIAMFKLRRLVLNEFDLKDHGHSPLELASLVHPDVHHDNQSNNTLSTLLPEVGEWKICFITTALACKEKERGSHFGSQPAAEKLNDAMRELAAAAAFDPRNVGIPISFVQIAIDAADSPADRTAKVRPDANLKASLEAAVTNALNFSK